ncbi:MAG: nickel pincer cofactor biosynthesis protein LarC [Cyanobacteria bacterium J06626_14]
MFSVAYVDCPTGISGDMCLGALVDAGVPLDYINQELQKLGIDHEYRLSSETVQRNGQAAKKVHVHVLSQQANHSETSDTHHGHHHQHPTHSNDRPDSDHLNHEHHDGQALSHSDHHHSEAQSNRYLPEITSLIRDANLSKRVEEWSLAIFQNLAKAEGLVHGISPEQVHFHEVGATDAIVDIVGTCLGFDYLNVTQFCWSALPTGGGTIRAAHGRLPVPAPAVLRLFELHQVPIYHNGINRELVTPTGAAIATTLASQFGPPPAMKLHRVGLGAGSRELPLPNILRLWLGSDSHVSYPSSQQSSQHAHHHHPLSDSYPVSATGEPETSLKSSDAMEGSPSVEQESVVVLETQLDDLSPQAIGYVFEALFQAGALDVFTQAVGMKKNRPGILLTVICKPTDIERCEAVVFQETTTLGIRRTEQQRSILHRELHSVETPYGIVHIKVARRSPHSSIINVHPEYEDCARLARDHRLPWLAIHRAAIQTWQRSPGA